MAAPYLCRETTQPKYLDGRFEDWAEPYFAIDGWFWRPAEGKTPVYGGQYDLSATVRLAWDATSLYVGLSILDDQFMPVKTGPIDAGDSVVITLTQAQRDTDATPAEFAITLGSQESAYRRDEAGELRKAEGVKVGAARMVLPPPTTTMACEKEKAPSSRITKVYYEIAIPWSLLPKITPQVNNAFALGLQVIDVDTSTVRGSLKWRGGRGISQTASGYGEVCLAASQ